MTTKLVPTLAGICALTFIAAAPAGATAQSGPSTSVSPYLVPVSSGVRLTSLLTVDDRSRPDPGVDMVGIPDGLGAFAQGRNVVLYMNHELTATAGAARAHGQTGAFVSRNVIDPVTGRIKQTSDLIQDVRDYDYATGTTSMRRPPEPPSSTVSAPVRSATPGSCTTRPARWTATRWPGWSCRSPGS